MNLESIDPPQLRTLLGMQESADPRAFWLDLIGELVTLSHDIGAELNPAHRTGFERLGVVKEGRLRVPVPHNSDNERLSQIAALVTDGLAGLFEKDRNILEKRYRSSPYAQEAIFQEYFISWYHCFYTAVTDRLIAQRVISRPCIAA
jgi:hypothetical protein